MCTVHWKAYVKGLNAERKARQAGGDAGTTKPTRTKTAPTAEATTKRERRRTPMANKPAPARVRKAHETLTATETLGGKAYTEAIGSEEVQAALETVNGHGQAELTPEQNAAVDAIATEADPRTEDEIRALEDDAA
jgi:hypothetical protein